MKRIKMFIVALLVNTFFLISIMLVASICYSIQSLRSEYLTGIFYYISVPAVLVLVISIIIQTNLYKSLKNSEIANAGDEQIEAKEIEFQE